MTAPVNYPVGTGYGVKGSYWAAGHHTGVDLLAPTGTTVVAPADSTIVGGSWGSAYGTHVIGETVVNGTAYRWMTAHMKSKSVTAGQKVKAGQAVGVSNNTGNTTGPHVHFEVRHSPFNYGDDVDPVILESVTSVPTPAKGTTTVFQVCFWNVASPRWYTPWAPRASKIGAEIAGEASVYGFAEVYSEDQAATIQNALGHTFQRVSGHAGLEFFYDLNKWQLERAVKQGGYASGIQGRYALVVHLTRLETGQHVAFVVTHGPVTYDNLKTQFGQWLAKLLGQIDGPIVLMGDFNRSVDSKSPRSNIRALGFRGMREQADITNESAKEFPSKGWNLSDIYTQPSGPADITGGEVDLTPAAASDHRRLEATVKVVAA